MRAFAYDASTYNASICEHMRMRAFASHCMRTHFSCVMRPFAYVIWASSVSVMRAYARIRMRCERIRIACARIRIACARIACECAHLRGTYACPVLYHGPRFNIEMSSYQYRNSHCGDEMVERLSYIHNGNSYTGKMESCQPLCKMHIF